MSYLYVISDGKLVKIGFSINPEKRLSQLQTGHPDKLELIYREQVPDDKALILEQLIHKANNHLRVRREWFKLTQEQAIDEVKFVIIRHLDN